MKNIFSLHTHTNAYNEICGKYSSCNVKPGVHLYGGAVSCASAICNSLARTIFDELQLSSLITNLVWVPSHMDIPENDAFQS